MSISTFNRRWAEVLIEALTRHGLRHMCIAPGSRSAPLTLAAAANGKLTCHTHFDERGLGHLALGLAKAARQPVGIIVTSGTAVANLYPAIIEARLTGERLVVLTADRPPELIDCGANQAIAQVGIFADHADALNLPRPTDAIPARWLISAVDNLLASARFGAVQINCPFAEPLYGEDDGAYQSWRDAPGAWWQQTTPWLRYSQQAITMRQPDWFSWRQKRGVVVAGRMSAEEGAQVAEWASTLGWPLLGDVLSQTGQPLACSDLWLNHPQARQTLAQAELVVQFGGGLTGKRLLQWQNSSRPENWWLVDSAPGRRDPAAHGGRRIIAAPGEWLRQHPAQPRAAWAGHLVLLSITAQQQVDAATQTFGEARLAHRLPELLPENGQLFVGNSLIVRLVDAFAQLPVGYPVYSNRGASGIDGLLSSAAGVQRAQPRPMLVLLGDISTLYDLNALALLRDAPAPLVVLVVNNNGGQIFSLLPTPEAERQRFFCMPQSVSFAPAAAMFGLQYACPENWSALQTYLQQCWRRGGSHLVELVVDAESGAQTLVALVKQMEEA
ncbi:2-succinyl-5-enolpyruvyl-6-hydroxy-3-cyclohexene-1-carboxylate synthase [Paramixta manurensis]|uniref:2-succinyl-5-enolpyruvyl-6-hydroxy-3-cyclohexene-1-carboxylate synthase n=1 Tax=Paramixta manurensis TaxID=2740817 RepID=A0A6M8UB72_9GAMM|nr:2-succinyl-5-enolpyruvyl-6-hydroxy-3-cyclohexene-1-carboxylate synthase [Erwiniaceae bacterium PD-1]